jgi:hypothetical protein
VDADWYVFELRAADPAGNLSIRTLMLAVATPPRLTAIGFAGDALRLALPTSSGTTSVLEFKDSLSATNWSALPAVTSNGVVLIFTDPAATHDQRFYRVRVTAPGGIF